MTKNRQATRDSSAMTQEERSRYFGYGSNMWMEQMHMRCPESRLIGLAKLQGWYWLINERHYANVVEITEEASKEDSDYPDVWGLLWSVTQSDLEKLDVYEGVKTGSYLRKSLTVEAWDTSSSAQLSINKEKRLGNGPAKPGIKVSSWVYVDPWRTSPSYPYEEYIERMNFGIRDARTLGIPEDYVEKGLRQFIPEKDVDEILKEDQSGKLTKNLGA
jgi:gamma-glutamylcyclotransferase